jgi:polyisoprenoid-binding protein YceI
LKEQLMMRVFSTRRLVSGALAAVALAVLLPPALAAGQAGPVRFELAPSGNEARYRVKEQLAGVDLPGEAVGATSAITGAVVLGSSGAIVPGSSSFTVDITGLKSDSARRDGYIQRNTLQTAQYPKVELAITELRGLKYPLPASGELKFELIGDLTVHGVTKPSTWQVTAVPRDGGIAGTATTSFAFADFGLTKPRVMSVLSVEDTIALEYAFHLVPKR